MPIYDYRCTSCNLVFQVEKPLGCLDEEACRECGGVAKRVFQIFENPPEIGGGACATHGQSEKILEDLAEFLAERDS